ncbi:MAG: DUF3347 domain-containing protein [Ferruginibacter sp.]
MTTSKNLFFGLTIAATTLAACNSGNDKTTGTKTNDMQGDTSMTRHAQPADSSTLQSTPITATFSAGEIIAGYLQIKNALANDNSKAAAAAASSIIAVLAKVDMKSISEQQMKSYMDVAGDLKEHAEHIGANAGKIEHQREHFIMLSKDMTDIIKSFGNGGQTLYKDFCPMANDGKGAIWLSEVKEIKNPYLGAKMPTCGSVKETLK